MLLYHVSLIFKLLQQNKNWYKDKFLGEPDMFTHFNW